MKKYSLASSTAILSAVNMALRLLGFGLRVWLSAQLGAHGMGLYQLVFPLFGLMMTLVTGGLPTALSRISAAEAYNADAALRSTRRFCLLLCIPLLGLTALLSPLICTYVLGEAQTLPVLLSMLPCILFASLSNVYSGYFYGAGNVVPGAVSQLSEQLIRILACVLFFTLLPSLPPALAASGAMLCMLIGEIGGFFCIRAFYHRPVSVAPMRGASRLLTESAPVTLLRLFGSALAAFTSVILPGRLTASGLSDTAALESFAAMTGMAQPLVFMGCTVTGALGVSLIPSLSSDVARGATDAARRKIRRCLALCGGFSLLCAVGLHAVSSPLGLLLYGREDVGHYLRLLAPLVVLAGLGNLTSSVLHGLSCQRLALRNHLIGAVPAVIGVLLASLPEVRLTGYAVGHWIGDGLCVVLNLLCIRNCLPNRARGTIINTQMQSKHPA